MTVYAAAKGRNTGAAVLVLPGGGFQFLAMDVEGTEICDWLTNVGRLIVGAVEFIDLQRPPRERMH